MSGRRLLRELGGIGPSAILVEDGRIAALDADAVADARAAPSLDGSGLTAVPGFVELQVNGIGGHDFTTDPDSIRDAGPLLARHGVTAFLLTVISAAPGTVEAAIRAFAAGPASEGAIPLGLHVEGPFIAPARAGAHPVEHLRDPDLGEVCAWLDSGAVRILTIAPERPGALEVVAAVAAAGAVASVGHTDADAGATARAIEAGARYATHLFNAMPPLAHRAPGAVGALLADERVTVGLIVDGRHLDPIVVALVARLAGNRVSLVSDAIGALDLPEGEHRLGDDPVLVADGAARRPVDGTLAGSVVGLDGCVRNYARATGSLEAAVRAVTSTPARLLGLGDRGSLAVGSRADVTLLDGDLTVSGTVIGGEIAFDRDGRWR
jgi:N-acetylglucosamine-6-phosphate deacetylase